MTERNITRWTREVAENPGAPSFVKLARAYRAQGRRDAARDVVLQGLEHNPEHLAGHGLLALIHVEDGERQKAGDEWQTVLRLDPDNFDASRGLGFLALERGDLADARRHLETAAASRPDDPAVAQALEVLKGREARGSGLAAGDTAPPSEVAQPTDSAVEERPIADTGSTGIPRAASPEPPTVRDPTRLFDVLSGEAPFLGGVVLDEQGLVLAGAVELEGARGELLGALINTAVGEARRTTEMLGLGPWDGMLMDCDEATVHVAKLPDDHVVLLAARPGAPAGWTVRTAERAQSLARGFLEERV